LLPKPIISNLYYNYIESSKKKKVKQIAFFLILQINFVEEKWIFLLPSRLFLEKKNVNQLVIKGLPLAKKKNNAHAGRRNTEYA